MYIKVAKLLQEDPFTVHKLPANPISLILFTPLIDSHVLDKFGITNGILNRGTRHTPCTMYIVNVVFYK